VKNTVFIFLAVFFAVVIGFLTGKNSCPVHFEKSCSETNSQAITSLSETKPAVKTIVSTQFKTEQVKPIDFTNEKSLREVMSKAPLRLVKKIYYDLDGDVYKKAYGEEFSKGPRDANGTRPTDELIFKDVLPAIKNSFYYFADGDLVIEGSTYQFEVLLTFVNTFKEKAKNVVPKTLKDFHITAIFYLSARSGELSEKPIFVHTGIGIYSTYRLDDKVFSSIYVDNFDNREALSNFPYMLIEIPTADVLDYGQVRVYSTSVSKWLTVSEKLGWQKISQGQFEAKSKDLEKRVYP
tara:strand:- start:20265 stop:21146 length:882 start_codon:yes stop_codon:yes gene_type:complete